MLPIEKRELASRPTLNVSGIVASITLTGIFFYGILYATYAAYYFEFDLTPEEIGANYGTILSRAVFVPLGATVILGAIPVLIALARWGTPTPQLISTRITGGVLVGLGLTLMFVSSWFGTLAAGGLALLFSRKLTPEVKENRTKSIAKYGRIVLTVLGLLIFASAFVLIYQAGLSAEDLKREGRVPHEDFFYNVTRIKPQLVTVQWIGPQQAPSDLNQSDRIYLLGQADGIVILFNYTHNRVIRVSNSSIVAIHEASRS
jgi:hypothetical protein